MNELIHELPLAANILENTTTSFADPMISLELAAITLTLLYLIKITIGDSKDTRLSNTSSSNSFAGELLQYVNVGNLISWPKRSLNNQRVLR
jgi:hypothetical protein